jgi:hypothetical protein
MLDRFFRVLPTESLGPRVVSLWLRLFDTPLPPPTRRESDLIEELKAACRALPALETEGLPGSLAAWTAYANTVRELILHDDPREFLRWRVIQTMLFAANQPYVFRDLRFLRHRADWKSTWRRVLRESPVGRPVPNALLPISSGNLIHQAYHLVQFEDHARIPVSAMNYIFEFGGGYGSMCRLFHNLGFRGKYVIFDLPIFSALQSYYLKATGHTVLPLELFTSAHEGVAAVSDQRHLKDLLSGVRASDRAMFIATRSISEIPVNERGFFLSLLSPFEAFLIYYSHLYREVDNVEFFRNWRESFSREIQWHNLPDHDMEDTSYLIGGKKRNGGGD